MHQPSLEAIEFELRLPLILAIQHKRFKRNMALQPVKSSELSSQDLLLNTTRKEQAQSSLLLRGDSLRTGFLLPHHTVILLIATFLILLLN
jgi:hypothetical protein